MFDVRQISLKPIKTNIHLHCESINLLLHRRNVGLKGALSGLRQFLVNLKPFKNDEKYEKCFLIYLKSSFHSGDIYIFVDFLVL